MKKVSIAALALCAISTNSFAVEYITGKVTIVEASYLPNSVYAQMDAGNSACPAGTWLKWEKSAESNKGAYVTLLAAFLNNSTVNFVINDGDTSCTGQFLHIRKP